MWQTSGWWCQAAGRLVVCLLRCSDWKAGGPQCQLLCARCSSQHICGLPLVQPAAQPPSRQSCVGSLLREQQLLVHLHSGQHIDAACLCRRGYDLAAFVQHGAQQALGLELSPTAVRCTPLPASIAGLAAPCKVEPATIGVSGLMCLTLLPEDQLTAGRGAGCVPQLSVWPPGEASVYAEGAQRHADALLPDPNCSA